VVERVNVEPWHCVCQDVKLRDTVTMGTKDVPLEDKTLTVVHGADLCNVNFINFTTNSRETAQVRIAYVKDQDSINSMGEM
jgi:hypothetical protein